jgi:hypothetical protein
VRWTETNACQCHAKTMERAWTGAMAFFATVFQDTQVFCLYVTKNYLRVILFDHDQGLCASGIYLCATRLERSGA